LHKASGILAYRLLIFRERIHPEITKMQEYVCGVCGYVYNPEEGDPDAGIEAGTAFEDLPEEWVCPVCGAGKEEFEPE
jgi:rubredoxin